MATPSPNRVRSDRFDSDIRRQLLDREGWCFRIAVFAPPIVAYAWMVLANSRWSDPSRYSPGQLAQVHAAWNGECAACHVPHGFCESQATGTKDVHGRWRDFTCTKCHAGPPHVPHVPLVEENCADCHRDHAGSGHSLKNLKDGVCTDCHATSHTSIRVSNFATHPEFRKLLDPKDP